MFNERRENPTDTRDKRTQPERERANRSGKQLAGEGEQAHEGQRDEELAEQPAGC